MKNIEDQMSEILRRAEVIKVKKDYQKMMIGFAVSIAACVALLVVVSTLIPDIKGSGYVAEASEYGSLVVSAPYFGFVVIGFLSFTLGVLITLLCLKVRDMKKFEQQDAKGARPEN